MKNMRAKKSLGQNFLNNKSIASDMAIAGDVHPGAAVVEIGPGKGILTEALLASGAKVIAIEKDDALAEFLKEKFKKEIKNEKLKIIRGDVLKTSDQLQVTSYKLIANIPYYITGAILKHFLSLQNQPSLAVLMIQKEVAERIVARDGKESILSISVKAYGEPKIVKVVKAGNFSPAPKVDSAILVVQNISRKNFQKISEEKFFEIVKAGFAQKRKLLAGNLKKMGITPEAFTRCNIPPNARAENLTIEQWLCLANTTTLTTRQIP